VEETVEVSKEPPNLDEIFDYAAYLGLDTALDSELLWYLHSAQCLRHMTSARLCAVALTLLHARLGCRIAEEALCCPLPPGWTEHTDSEGNVYFHHAADDVSTYEHPMDAEYKALAARAKADKSEAAIGALRDEILELKKQSFVGQADEPEQSI